MIVLSRSWSLKDQYVYDFGQVVVQLTSCSRPAYQSYRNDDIPRAAHVSILDCRSRVAVFDLDRQNNRKKAWVLRGIFMPRTE